VYMTKYGDYILDSGAFTFIMSKKKKNIDIDKFTDRYIKFINKHDIKLFFEMDVDKVYGYEKVKDLRRKIEEGTGKKSIPVFHMSRGLKDWKDMCENYNYIALGIAGKDFTYTDYKAFNVFVRYAKGKGVKVHGLGITGMTVLSQVPFYSVDSSSWTAGNRYKTIFKFDGVTVKGNKASLLAKKRISNHYGLARHNLKQWILFSNSMKNKKLL